jgi:predicted ATPase
MRRKPQFDRFMAGLSKRIHSLLIDEDWDEQYLVNVTRSECSRVWKYLIEKINKLEKENEELRLKIKNEKEEEIIKSQNLKDKVISLGYKGLSLREIEKLTGVTFSTVRRILKDHTRRVLDEI